MPTKSANPFRRRVRHLVATKYPRKGWGGRRRGGGETAAWGAFGRGIVCERAARRDQRKAVLSRAWPLPQSGL